MKIRIGLLCVLILAVAGVVQAQDAPAPVLMLINGEDIWASYPTGLARLTYSGYADRPALSPAGGQIAYPVIDRIGIQALQTTGGLVSELPSNIVLQNLTTRVETSIATQPEGATFNAGEPARAIVRSAPAWSPDGSALAWTEDVTPEAVRSLVIYTLASASAQVAVTDLPLQAGFQQTLPVRWGGGGIALHSITAVAEATAAQPTIDTFLIYSPAGALLASSTVTPATGEYVYDFQWIDDAGVDKLGVIYSTGRWDVIDPASGAVTPLVGSPELYSLSAPDGLSVVFGVTSLPNGAVFTWRVGQTPLAYTGPLEWLSISPAGDAIAYATQGIAYTWRDGVTEPVYGTNDYNMVVSDVVWGPTAWRVAGQ